MVHHHSSDERFCGSVQVGRQFSLNEQEVTCTSCKPVIVALVSAQGTACPETMLVNDEDTPEQRAEIEKFHCKGGDDAPIAGTWRDCSDNEVLIALWREAEDSGC